MVGAAAVLMTIWRAGRSFPALISPLSVASPLSKVKVSLCRSDDAWRCAAAVNTSLDHVSQT